MNKLICNEVNVTNAINCFTPKEFSKMGGTDWKFLNNNKKRKDYNERDSDTSKKQATTNNNRYVAAIINGIM